MNYYLVAFDFWETLVTRPFGENFYERLAIELGVQSEWVYEILQFTRFRCPDFDVSQFADRAADFLCDAVGTDGQRERILEVVHQFESADRAAATSFIPGAIELVDKLQRLKVPWVLVANATQHTKALVERLEWSERFDALVFSCDVGATKPSPAIFLASPRLRQALEGGKRICMIGDQFDRDVLGAQMLGVDSILFRNSEDGHSPVWHPCSPRIGYAGSYSDIEHLLFQQEPCP